jgi:hypothetical protein
MIERRKIPGWPETYEADSDGRIWSRARGEWYRVECGHLSQGYYDFATRVSGRRIRDRVHRLVAAAFLGPCPEGLVVNHKNGVPTDNRPENLEYVTQTDNVKHAIRTGLMPKGERRGHAKLNPDAVREIRALWAQGVPRPRIAERFGVVNNAVHQVLKGTTWSHVQ